MKHTADEIRRVLRATRLSPEAVADLLDESPEEVRKLLPVERTTRGQPNFARLATSSNPLHRGSAASGRKCRQSVLAQLARDNNWSVRAAVADNASSRPDLLRRLTADPDPAVRTRTASNHSSPPRRIATSQA